MIAWLQGVLRARRGDRVIVDVGGVGYDVRVPIGVAAEIALDESVTLHVYTHIREDQLALFGFDSLSQKGGFERLLAVTGIGPKLAVAILGGLSPAALIAAVEGDDFGSLTTISGVGKRLAQRMAVELKGKLELDPEDGPQPTSGTVAHVASGPFKDLASVLNNLGYRPKEIEGTVAELKKTHADGDLDQLIRAALASFRRA